MEPVQGPCFIMAVVMVLVGMLMVVMVLVPVFMLSPLGVGVFVGMGIAVPVGMRRFPLVLRGIVHRFPSLPAAAGDRRRCDDGPILGSLPARPQASRGDISGRS